MSAAAQGRAALVGARAALLVAQALVLAGLLAASSLARLLPFPLTGLPFLALVGLLLLALTPALLARESALPAAAAVTVPALALASYGASRLDWLRLLKDFGVHEADAWSPARLALGGVAVGILLALHVLDFAIRLRARAVERGIDEREAMAASSRSLRRNATALATSLAGAAGLLVVGLVGLQVGKLVPTERGAFVVPLAAALLLVAAALLLARPRRA